MSPYISDSPIMLTMVSIFFFFVWLLPILISLALVRYLWFGSKLHNYHHYEEEGCSCDESCTCDCCDVDEHEDHDHDQKPEVM